MILFVVAGYCFPSWLVLPRTMSQDFLLSCLPVTCSGTTVKLASREHEEVVIVGIDEYGYLRVQCKNGQELSLQPDGNTFDIMKGLIARK